MKGDLTMRKTISKILLGISLVCFFVWWLSGLEITYLKASGLKSVTKTKWVPDGAVIVWKGGSTHGFGEWMYGKSLVVFDGEKGDDVLSVAVNFTGAIHYVKQIAGPNVTWYPTKVKVFVRVEGGFIQQRNGQEFVKVVGTSGYKLDDEVIYVDWFEGTDFHPLLFDVHVICFRQSEAASTHVWLDYEISVEAWEEEPHQEKYETLELTFTPVTRRLLWNDETPCMTSSGELYYMQTNGVILLLIVGVGSLLSSIWLYPFKRKEKEK